MADHRIVDQIVELIHGDPEISGLFTSRPSRQFPALAGFDEFELQNFSTNEITTYLNKSLPSDISKAIGDTIHQNKYLADICANPLLLNFAISIYQEHGPALPKRTYDLLDTTMEMLLSGWDSLKSIPNRSSNTLFQNYRILCILSIKLFTRSKHWFNKKDFRLYFGDESFDTLNYFIQRNIITEYEDGIFCFSHVLFYHFFIARYYILEINPNERLIIPFDEEVGDFILQAENPTAVTRYYNAVEKTTISISKYWEYIVRYISISNNDLSKNQSAITSDQQNTLIKLWDKLISGDSKTSKGKRLEEFVRQLFLKNFDVIRQNSISISGEFDLILENNMNTPFWLEYNVHYLIECKNWEKAVDVKQVRDFCYKVDHMNSKLGFFISMSGFTKVAIDEFQMISNRPTSPMIVPITGGDLGQFVNGPDDDVEKFLKTIIRKIKFNKKY